MSTTLRGAAVVAFLVIAAGCESPGPTWPTDSPSPQPQPPINFPPLSGPSRTFTFDREVSYPVHAYTKVSRIVVYENGAFVLQYPGLSEGGYPGKYTDADGLIIFEWWEGGSAIGPWVAFGTLKDNSLTVRYNDIMRHDDFEDAVYLQIP